MWLAERVGVRTSISLISQLKPCWAGWGKAMTSVVSESLDLQPEETSPFLSDPRAPSRWFQRGLGQLPVPSSQSPVLTAVSAARTQTGEGTTQGRPAPPASGDIRMKPVGREPGGAHELLHWSQHLPPDLLYPRQVLNHLRDGLAGSLHANPAQDRRGT